MLICLVSMRMLVPRELSSIHILHLHLTSHSFSCRQHLAEMHLYYMMVEDELPQDFLVAHRAICAAFLKNVLVPNAASSHRPSLHCGCSISPGARSATSEKLSCR